MSKALIQQARSDLVIPGTSPWGSPDYLELRGIEASHTIIQQVGRTGGIYTMDALTDQGWLRTVNVEVEEDDRERLLTLFACSRELQRSWRKPRTTMVISYRPVVAQDSQVKGDHSRTVPTKNLGRAWSDSAESILARIEDPATDPQERDTAVLFAGSTAFTDEQRPRLLSALGAYITQHRFTRDDDRITVVSSAAREYAMNMGEAEFERYAEWLLPEETEYLTHRVELELIKGICWRLSFERIAQKDEFPTLARTLYDIAVGYTNSRFLLQKNFAAIAMNAIVSVFVLDAMAGREELAAEVWSQVGKANRKWFTEMLQRRLADTVAAIREHDDALSRSVDDLVQRICKAEKDG
jgi:hypothetical protein